MGCYGPCTSLVMSHKFTRVRRGRRAILVSEGIEQLINDIRVNQFGFDISEEEDYRKNFKCSYLPEVYRVLPPDQLI